MGPTTASFDPGSAEPDVAPTDVWFGFDPFTPPAHRTPAGDAEPRARIAVAGTVTDIAHTQWAGGPALEATITDDSGSLVLAFLGRREIAGVQVGRHLTAGGTVVPRRGRLIIMNPNLWLAPDERREH